MNMPKGVSLGYPQKLFTYEKSDYINRFYPKRVKFENKLSTWKNGKLLLEGSRKDRT
jgi:hypothetical protein